MHHHDGPSRDGPPRTATAASLAELRFDDGAFAIYDPDNEAAWLWTADPVEL